MSLMSTLLPLLLFGGAAVALIKRCEEPFTQLGLCPPPAEAPAAVEAVAPCCTCTESGGKVSCTGTDDKGKSFTKTYTGALASAQTQCDAGCVVAEAQEVKDDDNDDDDDNNNNNKKKNRGKNNPTQRSWSKTKKTNSNPVGPSTRTKPAGRSKLNTSNVLKSSRSKPSLYAHSYFADQYNIRPYTSFRGRMSL